MIERINPLLLARAALLPVMCITVMSYFAFHAVSGNTGLVAWQNYKVERLTIEREAVKIAAVKAALRRRVGLLDPHHVDRDYADELVRRDLGVVRPDEVIIPLPEAR